MGMGVNFNVVRALLVRDLRLYFTSPSGYVFITLFIFLSAAAAFWQSRFFLSNLANLDQLTRAFPQLLLLFIPALTMSVWSEERKQGTDELLLTLPASDLEIVLGKYLAVVGVYTASLVLSLSHVLVLSWLGDPDVGLMFGNYFGFWLLGAALIAVGMLGSLLTINAAIAFVLGAILCAALIFVEVTVSLFSASLARAAAPFGVLGHFQDFSDGVVSLSGVLYFLSIAGVFLYVNVLLLGRRHWPRVAGGLPMGMQHVVRATAAIIIVVCANAVIARASARMDVTAERLHTLTAQTHELLDELSVDRPVLIRAYISPDVPEQYVQTRSNLLGLLREIDALAGPKIEVLIEDTEAYSDAAVEAQETFGIRARPVPDLGGARAGFSDVFLGLAFACGAEEQVIQFFDRGLPAEYEIARSIRVVAQTERKRVGVVNTGIRLFGGLDFQTMQSTPPWSIVQELRKQYEVVEITPTGPIADELDGLVVALPSSLTQDQMDNVQAYVEEGHPTLLLVDPLPVVDIGLAPSEEPGGQTNPFTQQNQPPPPPKGDVRALLSDLGVRWDSAAVTWDARNPHPDLAHLPPEVIFVGAGNADEADQGRSPFNQEHRASAGLQEVVLLYPGYISAAAESDFTFSPLLSSGPLSGVLPYSQMVQRSFFGVQLNPSLPHQPTGQQYVLAAHVTGSSTPDMDEPQVSDDTTSDSDDEETGGDPEVDTVDAELEGDQQGVSVDVVVVADLDFISQQFFDIRRAGPENLNFDNISFFLNAIDILVGDESFVELRRRRVRHRTLSRVEEQTETFIEQRAIEEQQAEDEAEQALADAQQRLNERVQEVRDRADLDDRAKQIMARNLEEVENRRLEVLGTNIETEKEAKIQRSRQNMELQIRQIQSSIRTLAVMLPPLPVFAFGVGIFLRRKHREREGAAAAKRLKP